MHAVLYCELHDGETADRVVLHILLQQFVETGHHRLVIAKLLSFLQGATAAVSARHQVGATHSGAHGKPLGAAQGYQEPKASERKDGRWLLAGRIELLPVSMPSLRGTQTQPGAFRVQRLSLNAWSHLPGPKDKCLGSVTLCRYYPHTEIKPEDCELKK